MVKTDQIPVISQAKSLVQLAAGDTRGAKNTQRTFLNECPVVSQAKSYYQWKDGDQLGAMITQAKFINATKESVVCILNGTPVIGHAKAMAHYVMGDSQSGNQAMKAATRSMGVITGGTLGMTVDVMGGILQKFKVQLMMWQRVISQNAKLILIRPCAIVFFHKSFNPWAPACLIFCPSLFYGINIGIFWIIPPGLIAKTQIPSVSRVATVNENCFYNLLNLILQVGGPVGAFAGGIAGGASVDAITTKVESAIANEYRPNGVFYLKERIEKGDVSAAEVFDAATGITMDGLAGYIAGRAKKPNVTSTSKADPKRSQSVPIGYSANKEKKAATVQEQVQTASYTDSIMLLNARAPIGKPDTEDENMKVLRLLGDIKKLQKKWKAKL